VQRQVPETGIEAQHAAAAGFAHLWPIHAIKTCA
jgi:hypothetical protein